MTPHPPYFVSVREQRTGGNMRAARVLGSYDPSGFPLLTIFVHGYNNSQNRATARWQDHIFPGIRDLTTSAVDGVVLFFWPGDSHSIKIFSSPQYPLKVRTAIDAGVELGSYVRRIAEYNPGLQVQFVGHSLGCRVVLSAARELSRDPQMVPVLRLLLMGAAVPEGDCEAPGPWREPLATDGEVVLHSRDDVTLNRWFPVGEFLARRASGLKSSGSDVAVGLTGGPSGRWSGEPKSYGLNHDDYPKHKSALRHVAAMFGPLTDRFPAELHCGERALEEQQPDERKHESVRTLG